MLKRTVICIMLVVVTGWIHAQEIRTYPTHWWTGMKNRQLQLMVHSSNQLPGTVTTNYSGIKIVKTEQPENKNYLFINLEVAGSAKPGTAEFSLTDGRKFRFELKAKNSGNGTKRIQGVHSSDFIYLIMPDRFANGEPSNDRCSNCRDTASDRSSPFARHGGDIKGVQDHLDYLKDLGVTTVWMTPIMENNMPRMQEGRYLMSGYHGYWITDHYRVDPRFGTNETYRQLVDVAHTKGMKIIQDAVYNHVGSFHHTVLDPPMKNWLNQWPQYQGSNHREEVFMDPYVSESDKNIMIGGWFVPHLPDLNLANPFVAKFIIQNTIWATEEFGIDGWRVDTYKYCDEQFLNDINTALLAEFPKLTVFGEAWTHSVPSAAYFVENNLEVPFKHNAQGVTDFPVNSAIYDAVINPADWRSGIGKMYQTLSQDFMYKDPLRNCIFLDNHDMDRFLSVVNENPETYKMGIGLLLTLRGIPEMYYGTEVLMKNKKDPTDAEVRREFPGGWAGDSANKFTAAGRTAAENEAFEYVRKLATFRKTSAALGSGKTLHYIPQDGCYVFFRYTGQQTVMCILNTNSSQTAVKPGRYNERLKGFTKGRDVLTGKELNLESEIPAPSRSLLVLELK